MKFQFLFFIVSIVLFSCTSNQPEDKAIEDVSSETTEHQTSNSKLSKKDTSYFLETAIGKLPVYSSFEGVAPLFKKNNDTTYIINFWATWCKPCIKELPYFEQVQEKYESSKVQVILISIDSENQLKSKLIPFLATHSLRSKVVIMTDNDYNNWTGNVDEKWNGAIPVTYFYNNKQKIFQGKSFADMEEIEVVLRQLL